jgi:IS30 family transposase
MRREKNLTTRDKWELRQYREAGVSVRECAQLLNCSEATAYRALAELRRKFGPEKIHRLRRQYARPTLRHSLIDQHLQPPNLENRE